MESIHKEDNETPTFKKKSNKCIQLESLPLNNNNNIQININYRDKSTINPKNQ